MRGAAVIFFAYIGFDAVSTAAEEVKDPTRDLPLGILGSLFICTAALHPGRGGVLPAWCRPARSISTAPLASAFRAARDARRCRDHLGGRSGWTDLGAVGAAARTIANFFRGLARRIAAARVQQNSSAVSHAVHPDHADRHRGRNHRGAAADRGNRGAHQHRDAVRIRARMPRGMDSALRGSQQHRPFRTPWVPVVPIPGIASASS